MRGGAFGIATAIMLTASTGNAFDPTGVDILGLRLGMPEAETVVALRHQGFAVGHDHGALTAKTRDGQLSVNLTEDRTIQQVRYSFAGRGPNEAETIRASILDRFGPPDQANPMTWCQTIGQQGACAAGTASLTFLPDTLTLLLRTGAEAR